MTGWLTGPETFRTIIPSLSMKKVSGTPATPYAIAVRPPGSSASASGSLTG